jgi:hypothetical protein
MLLAAGDIEADYPVCQTVTGWERAGPSRFVSGIEVPRWVARCEFRLS